MSKIIFTSTGVSVEVRKQSIYFKSGQFLGVLTKSSYMFSYVFVPEAGQQLTAGDMTTIAEKLWELNATKRDKT